MKLISCNIENFGKLHNFKYDFNEGLNIILADNGWGKTTFAAFIKAMFYGLDYTTKKSILDNERKRYMPWQGGNYGGNVRFSVADGTYRIERYFGAKDKDDMFCVYNEITGQQCNDFGRVPGEVLFGIDAYAFIRSIFIPQENVKLEVNDSLSNRLSNMEALASDVNFDKAVELIDAKLRFYKKTGGRGYISQLEYRIAQIGQELLELSNKTESMEKLKNKKAEIENKRAGLLEQLRIIQSEIKRTNEFEAIKAKKMHYDMLRRQMIESKSKYDSLKMFFETPELAMEIDERKEDFANLEKLIVKQKDESENVKELEYKKHSLESQYAANKRSPFGSLAIVLIGVLAIIAGVVSWMLLDADIIMPIAISLVGVGILVFGVILALTCNAKLKYKYDQDMAAIEDELGSAKASLKDYNLKKEILEKKLVNYIRQFQVEHPTNFIKSLMEIENKMDELEELKRVYEQNVSLLDEFSKNNDIEKITSLTEPKFLADDLRKKEENLNVAVLDAMEEKNQIARRMDVLSNSSDDENDLLVERENLIEELENAKKDYNLLTTTLNFLNEANEAFKVKYIEDMKNSFRKYVMMLDGGILDNVAIDIDLNVFTTELGVTRPAETLSLGYRNLLNLCTRFALVDSMYKGEKPFVILDDPFVNLDENKLVAAKKLLSDLSASHQIIYFTCHSDRV